MLVVCLTTDSKMQFSGGFRYWVRWCARWKAYGDTIWSNAWQLCGPNIGRNDATNQNFVIF